MDAYRCNTLLQQQLDAIAAARDKAGEGEGDAVRRERERRVELEELLVQEREKNRIAAVAGEQAAELQRALEVALLPVCRALDAPKHMPSIHPPVCRAHALDTPARLRSICPGYTHPSAKRMPEIHAPVCRGNTQAHG